MGRRGHALVLVAALGCLLLYSGWAVSYLTEPGHSPLDFIGVGQRYAGSGAQRMRDMDPRIRPARGGYDGQFAYYIALHPARARGHLDDPAYRYSRILYPLAARALALGQPRLIPWTLWLINLLSIVVGVWALGRWLAARGVNPLVSAVYGLFPGQLEALSRDTTEPMAYALVALGLLALDLKGRRGLLLAAAAFAAAVLTRESAAVFVVPIALGVWLWRAREAEHPLRDAVILVAVAAAPSLVLRAGLTIWLGYLALAGVLTFIPFGGLGGNYPWNSHQFTEIQFLVIPALLVSIPALLMLRAQRLRVAGLTVLLNVLLLVVFLPPASYVDYSSMGRIDVGLVLAAVVALPGMLAVAGGLAAFAASAALWLAITPLWTIIPLAEWLIGKGYTFRP